MTLFLKPTYLIKSILTLSILILLISCEEKKPTSDNTKKTEPTSHQTTNTEDNKTSDDKYELAANYIGKIGANLEVAFHIDNDKGALSGFYYYKKTGIDIDIVGTIKNNQITIYELNHKKDTVAKIKAVIDQTSIVGKWVNTKTAKEYALSIKETDTAITPLPSNILGTYYDRMCDLTLSFSTSKGEYYYTYTSNKRKLNGKVSFYRDEDLYINLTNIEYAEDYFDVMLFEEDEEREKEYEKLKEIGKRTVGVECYFSPDEVTIQNHGNAMNYYVKLYDCSEKYIHFQRQ